jgi:trimethylamine-N-oxide reductase cytochrome c-type subunit TorC
MRLAATKDGKTCIDCHKGIAHKLPDMAARHRAQFAALTAASATLEPAVGARLLTLATKPFFLERPKGEASEAGKAGDGTLFAATPVTVLARDGAWLKVEATGWRREASKSNLFAEARLRIPTGTLTPQAAARFEPLGTVTDPDSDEVWTQGRLGVWTTGDRLTADSAALWRYGAELYDSNCSFCHALPSPADHDANKWIGHMNSMKRFVDLDEGQFGFLQKYLQLQAKGSSGLMP